MKKHLLLFAMMLLPTLVMAYDIEVQNSDGVTFYYNYTNDGTELEVARGTKPYTGNIVIPNEVTYMNRIRKVTGIGSNAFSHFNDLTSITIPNSVTSIGLNAFEGCSGLTKVVISDIATWCGIKFMGEKSNPLYCAGHLYSDENTEIKDLVIPNSVTKISSNAFSGCSGLTSVTIGSSVTWIGGGAFSGCSELKKVIVSDIAAWCGITFGYNANPLHFAKHLYSDENTEIEDLIIPNSVMSISGYAFEGCSSLTSVTIDDSVTSIGGSAFSGCSGLTSITIGSGVTSIGGSAFSGCSALTSITIGSGVTSIGEYAFEGCSELKKVIVPNIAAWCGITFVNTSGYNDEIIFMNRFANPLIYTHHLYSDENTEITDLVIPNSVTSIGKGAFFSCSGLTSVTIPNSVTSIGEYAFEGCSDLKKVIVSDIAAWCGIKFCRYNANPLYFAKHLYSDENTEIKDLVIPNSVTSISNYAFDDCRNFTSATIGNSVTGIGDLAFSGCSGLTSVTIGNSVTSIGDLAFSHCYGLTSVTIPNSVTSIGERSFISCTGLTSVTIGNSMKIFGKNAFDGVDIPTVISLIEDPYTIKGKTSNDRAFTLNTFNNATLYVPKGTINKYKTKDGWKDFVFIEDGDTPQIPEKCEKPTISYQNGKLMFGCATEGSTCHYSITDTDIKDGSGNEVQLTATYNITVYAKKDGYQDSEAATATLCWIDVEPQTEGVIDGDAIAEVKAMPILIQSQGSAITIQGAAEGTPITVYDISGKQYGSTIAEKDRTTIITSLCPGSVAIVKIGEKTIKVRL